MSDNLNLKEIETDCVKPADIPFEKYKKLEMENEALKDAIVKLTIKVMSLEKTLHPDVW